MTVGVIQSQHAAPTKRRKAYACDITYGTAKEFGFDFLRDRLLLRRIREGQTDLVGQMLGHGARADSDKPVQRERRTSPWSTRPTAFSSTKPARRSSSARLPSEAQKAEAELYQLGPPQRQQFVEDEHYEYDHEKKTVELTAAGRPLRPQRCPSRPAGASRHVRRSTSTSSGRSSVDKAFILDRHYVVRDGEIVIVDEFTGRLAEGRKWRDGIASGHRSQGRRRSHGRHRPGRPHHHPGLLPALPASGRHDGHGRHARPASCGRSTRSRVVPDSDESPADSRASLPTASSAPPTINWPRSSRKCCEAARHGPAGADRHALDRQIGNALRAALAPRGIEHQVLNARADRQPKPRSSPRPVNRAASRSRPTWPAAEPIFASAKASPSSAACT